MMMPEFGGMFVLRASWSQCAAVLVVARLLSSQLYSGRCVHCGLTVVFQSISQSIYLLKLEPRAGSGVVRIDSLRFLAGCRTRRLDQALSVLSLKGKKVKLAHLI